ncbi:MAG: divalent metal cation transporter [Bacteroidota bacterium]|nr:divalent metal cation transporter [Bacteroidota bacterium]MDP4215658.1 divalent metal cation transporter [Bacteroidota bacterium]MDP4247843.1 divalent metal cation transporter [Bacteroidota bacterium]MDP4259772.1 divalent metal cation transporter [Bacteroidota bacterium]
MKPKTKFSAKIKKALKIMGPGLITGASDDDPSGIATYSQAGAQFGMATLWTALITFPLMASIQEMCARIGAVTSKGLTGVLKSHYPKGIIYLMMAFSFPAIVLNIGADIEGMGAVAHLLLPGMPVFAFEILFTGMILFGVILYPYQKIAGILKWLCMVLLLYIIIPFLVKNDWAQVLKHTVIPTIHMNKEFFSILVAILGTTISPYLFFWQATMEAEDIHLSRKRVIVDKRFMEKMKLDVYLGMLFSNVVMFFIILTTGVVLYTAGIRQIDTVEQAAKALEPLAGKVTYAFFAIGVIGTGFLAIPVLGGSLSYIVAETFNWRQGLDKKFNQAPGFYVTLIVSLMAGLCLDFLNISPIQALIYTAVLYGLTSPVMIAVVLHICNNPKIMGTSVNRKGTNILGVTALILMTAAAVALLWFQFAH